MVLLLKGPPFPPLRECRALILPREDRAEGVVEDPVHFVGVRDERVDNRWVGDKGHHGCVGQQEPRRTGPTCRDDVILHVRAEREYSQYRVEDSDGVDVRMIRGQADLFVRFAPLSSALVMGM